MKGKIWPSHIERTNKQTKKTIDREQTYANIVKRRASHSTRGDPQHSILHDMSTDFMISFLVNYSLEVMVGLNQSAV